MREHHDDSHRRKSTTENGGVATENVDNGSGSGGHANGAATPDLHLDEKTRSVSLRARITDPEIYQVLADLPETERREFALRALKVGVVALRDIRTVAKADYVDKEFERMRSDLAQLLEGMFGDGGEVTRRIQDVFGEDGRMDERLRTFFGPEGRLRQLMDDFLGQDGRLRRALENAVGDDGALKRTLDEFLGEKGRLRRELDRFFDADDGRLHAMLNPADESTPLGAFRKSLEERFDPAREGSFLWRLHHEMEQHFQEIRKHLEIREAVEEEHERGTRKGFDFEDHVSDVLGRIASPFGDRVEKVGDETGPLGKAGDILCHLHDAASGPAGRRIVVEVKDTGVTLSGKTSIQKTLNEAMQNRDADFAIAVVEAEHADRFAPFRYEAPDHLLVSLDGKAEGEVDELPLRVAYHLARTLLAARTARREVELDVGSIQSRLQEIRAQLEAVRSMKGNLTRAKTSIENVRSALDEMRESVLDVLKDLEADLVRSGQEKGGDSC